MVAVTYTPSEPAAPRKSWGARFLAALMEARRQQANREINMHVGLVPYRLVDDLADRPTQARS